MSHLRLVLCLLALVPLTSLLPGCASMSRDECLTADWRTIGYEDGLAGRSADRIAEHRKACAKSGVTPDLRAWQDGREQGLREFCQPQNGYRIGERGGEYDGSCPADLAPAFEAAWHDGFELHERRARVNQAASDVRNMQAQLQRAEEDMVTASALIIDHDADTTAKARALLDVQRLAERQGVLKAQIRQRQEDQVHFQRDLDEYLARQ